MYQLGLKKLLFGSVFLYWAVMFSCCTPQTSFSPKSIIRKCPNVQCNYTNFDTLASSVSNCRCDVKCRYFGDCCFDSPTAKYISLTSPPNPGNCSLIPSLMKYIYVTSYCDSSKGGMTAVKCQAANNYTEQVKDIVVKIPVTDTATGITYGNYFCADCREITSYTFWSVKVQCETTNDTIQVPRLNGMSQDVFVDRPDLKSRLKFNNTTATWQINIQNRTENCILIAVPPNRPDGRPNIRDCNIIIARNIINTCPANRTEQGDRCPGYVSIVRDRQKRFFRNEFCAACNDVEMKNARCAGRQRYNGYYSGFPFESPMVVPPLLNVATGSISAATNVTIATAAMTVSTSPSPSKNTSAAAAAAAANTTTKTTAATTTTATRITTRSTSTTMTTVSTPPPASANQKRAYVYIQFNSGCTETLKMLNISKVEAETVYYTTINRTFIRSRTLIPGTTIQKCNMSKPIFPEVDSEESIHVLTDILCFSALTFSSILLFLHLFEYLSTKTGKNLSQKALAGYTFALLIANIGFLLDEYSLINPRYCLMGDVLEYYGCVSTFFWLSSMAFEVTCNVWNVANDLQTREGEEKSTRLSVYSWLSWVGAGVITIVMLRYRKYVEFPSCNFAYEVKLFDFFTFPLIISMSMNLAFYTSSVYVICTHSQVGNKLSNLRGIDFGLQGGLTLLGTLMWVSLYLSGYFVNWPLWLLFIMLNCMLAFLIYLYSPVQNGLSKKIRGYITRYSVMVGL